MHLILVPPLWQSILFLASLLCFLLLSSLYMSHPFPCYYSISHSCSHPFLSRMISSCSLFHLSPCLLIFFLLFWSWIHMTKETGPSPLCTTKEWVLISQNIVIKYIKINNFVIWEMILDGAGNPSYIETENNFFKRIWEILTHNV